MAEFKYVGDKDAPLKIKFMGKVDFELNKTSIVTDEAVIKKLKGNQCFVEVSEPDAWVQPPKDVIDVEDELVVPTGILEAGKAYTEPTVDTKNVDTSVEDEKKALLIIAGELGLKPHPAIGIPKLTAKIEERKLQLEAQKGTEAQA